jgi:hypothetical protein
VAPPVVAACTHPPVEIKNSHISFLPHLQKKKSIKKQIKRHKKGKELKKIVGTKERGNKRKGCKERRGP